MILQEAALVAAANTHSVHKTVLTDAPAARVITTLAPAYPATVHLQHIAQEVRV